MATRTSLKKWIPRNVREAVLKGCALQAGFSTAGDDFTGPNTLTRCGEIEPDIESHEAHFVIPYIARIKFGKPRRVKA